LGRQDAAEKWWLRAAREKGDFQQMSVLDVSDTTFWSGLAFKRLKKDQEAAAIFQRVHGYSLELESIEPKIDYFATSLPAMLLFEDDLACRNRIYALFLRAQAAAGMERAEECETLLRQVLEMDGNHNGAADLLRLTQKPRKEIVVS
jgi:hypothetical protein